MENNQQKPQSPSDTKDGFQLWMEEWVGIYSIILVRTAFTLVLSYVLSFLIGQIITVSSTVKVGIIFTIFILMTPFLGKLTFLEKWASHIPKFYINLYRRTAKLDEKKENKDKD